MSEVTKILQAIQSDTGRYRSEDLLPLVYSELHRLASVKLHREAPGNSLHTTDLVHEAYLRLVGDEQLSFDGRAHFFAAAAEAMRRILIDRARKRHAQKRGGKLIQMELHPDGVSSNGQPAVEDLMALNDSLSRLESLDKTKAELVKLRFFAGLSMPEIAAMMDTSLATTERRWRFCRAWLKRDMER